MARSNPPTTCPSLLRLLALPGMDEAWELFIVRYGPQIDARCRAAGLQLADAEDIKADVYARLVKSLRSFRYDPARRFRGYLQEVVNSAIRSHWRRLQQRPGSVGLGGADTPLPEPLARIGAEIDEEIRARVEAVLRAFDRIRFGVDAKTWDAFVLTTIDGLKATEAADRLDTTVGAIYMAKVRIRKRLEDELAIDRPTDQPPGRRTD